MRFRSLIRSRCSELVSMLCGCCRCSRARWALAYSRSRSRKLGLLLRAGAARRARDRRGRRSCPGAGWRAAARAGGRSRPCRRRRSCGPRRIFLSSTSCSTRSMMSPICSMLIVNETMSVQRRPSRSDSASREILRQVELDRRIQRVDRVVHLAQLLRRARGRCARITVSMPRSIVSTTSAWCSASRAAQLIASDGVSSAIGSRWFGRSVADGTGAASQRVDPAGHRRRRGR